MVASIHHRKIAALWYARIRQSSKIPRTRAEPVLETGMQSHATPRKRLRARAWQESASMHEASEIRVLKWHASLRAGSLIRLHARWSKQRLTCVERV